MAVDRKEFEGHSLPQNFRIMSDPTPDLQTPNPDDTNVVTLKVSDRPQFQRFPTDQRDFELMLDQAYLAGRNESRLKPKTNTSVGTISIPEGATDHTPQQIVDLVKATINETLIMEATTARGWVQKLSLLLEGNAVINDPKIATVLRNSLVSTSRVSEELLNLVVAVDEDGNHHPVPLKQAGVDHKKYDLEEVPKYYPRENRKSSKG